MVFDTIEHRSVRSYCALQSRNKFCDNEETVRCEIKENRARAIVLVSFHSCKLKLSMAIAMSRMLTTPLLSTSALGFQLGEVGLVLNNITR